MISLTSVSFWLLSLSVLYVNLSEAELVDDEVDNGISSDSDVNKLDRFYYVNKSMEWMSAQMYCADRGGRLANIKSIAADNKVLSLLPKPSDETDYVWVGGVCLVPSRPCFWYGPPNKRIGYNHFHPSEPSFTYYGGCVAFSTYYDDTWYWVEEYCSTPHTFVCETTPSH